MMQAATFCNTDGLAPILRARSSISSTQLATFHQASSRRRSNFAVPSSSSFAAGLRSRHPQAQEHLQFGEVEQRWPPDRRSRRSRAARHCRDRPERFPDGGRRASRRSVPALDRAGDGAVPAVPAAFFSRSAARPSKWCERCSSLMKACPRTAGRHIQARPHTRSSESSRESHISGEENAALAAWRQDAVPILQGGEPRRPRATVARMANMLSSICRQRSSLAGPRNHRPRAIRRANRSPPRKEPIRVACVPSAGSPAGCACRYSSQRAMRDEHARPDASGSLPTPCEFCLPSRFLTSWKEPYALEPRGPAERQ